MMSEQKETKNIIKKPFIGEVSVEKNEHELKFAKYLA